MGAGTSARSAVRTRARAPRLPALGATIGIYLLGQAIAVAVLAWMSYLRGYSLVGRLTSWDGHHFLAIAQSGYTWETSSGTEASPAFLPGYPALIAAVHWIGVPVTAAAIMISVGAGIAFACAIPHLVRAIPRSTRRAELVTVAVVAVAPMSVVLSMAYSEALFCALASWSLVFALRARWGVAGLLGFAAGTVRISGLALAAAFAVAAVVALGRSRGAQAAAKPAGAAALTAAATAGWILYSGIKMGSPTAWFAAQEDGWQSRVDFGVETVRFIYRVVTTAPSLLEVVTAVIIIAGVVLLVASIRQRQPLLVLVYSAAAYVEVVASAGVMNSRIRLLIPAFLLLAPLAARLARLPDRELVASYLGLAAASAWFGGYALAIWPYAI